MSKLKIEDIKQKYVNEIGEHVNLAGEGGDFTANLLYEIFDWFEPYLKSCQEIQKDSEWISLPPKELLKSGHYWFELKHPKTGIEDIVIHEVTNGLHGYAYATRCQLIPPPTK